ncbi:hypothetical protein V6N11_081356 [Hibiscus sabdariffa]|uniref:Uncharacterized protein n=1 Tax=Hibiscus sabdariffa TaxID=183260 RepID=A0ABR2QJS2_9ROSI
MPSNAILYSAPAVSSLQGYPHLVSQVQNPMMTSNLTGPTASVSNVHRAIQPSSSTTYTHLVPQFSPVATWQPSVQPINSQAFLANPEVVDDNASYLDSGKRSVHRKSSAQRL